MSREITVKEALAMPGAKLIDVRSESEFGGATLPGAINIPLLRDRERAAVGTTYKNEGVENARQMGLEFVSPRLPDLIKEFQALSPSGPLVVFCWRGGMRSKSVCSLLESVGINVYRLVGGYKAYRRYINGYLNRALPHKAVVLHGNTGVGKTELLEQLAQLNLPAVDLEGLANNRGSVFGQIGLKPQPGQKMFESLLVEKLALFESKGYIIVECESRRIGKLLLPDSLVNEMRSAVRILAYASLDARIERIIRIYGGGSPENIKLLKNAIGSLTQRIGKNKANQLTEMLDKNDFREVVSYLLVNYYDPLYQYPCNPTGDYDFFVDTGDIKSAAEQTKQFLQHRMGS